MPATIERTHVKRNRMVGRIIFVGVAVQDVPDYIRGPGPDHDPAALRDVLKHAWVPA